MRRARGAIAAPLGRQNQQPGRPPLPLLKDLYRLALMMFIVQTVSRVGSSIGILAKMRPAAVLFAFCLIYALLNPPKAFARGFFRTLIPRLTLGQAFIACCSALFGISLGHSAVYILHEYWKFLAFSWLLMASFRDATDLRRTIWATTLGGFVLAYLSLYVVGISKSQGTGAYDANDVGVIMVTTIPIGLLCLQASSRWGKVLAGIGLALTIMTVVKSGSRGAFVGAAAIAIAMLVLLPGISVVKRLGMVVAMSTTMSIVAPAGYFQSMWELISNPKSDYNWDSVNGRRNIAKRGIGYMLQYPVFGVGINNFTFAEGMLSDKARQAEGTNKGVRWAAPHNSFVEAGAETGMVGLAVWVLVLVVSGGGLWRLRRRMPDSWSTGTADQRFLYLSTLYVPIALIGFIVTASFVSFAWSDQYYLLPAIVVGAHKAFDGLSSSSSRRAPVSVRP